MPRIDRRLVLIALPLAAFVVAGLAAPLLAPHAPTATNLAASLQPPSGDHLLGTDQLGRDQLSRLLYGARTSLALVAIVLGVAVAGGVALGLVAGYAGGLLDRLTLRVIEIALTLPSLIIALAVLGARGTGTANLVLALAITSWPPFARLARAQVVSLRRSEHVDALRVLGAGRARILGHHLLPAALVPVLVYASLELGGLVLSLAFLSFLGLGIAPPQPEWGQMLIDARPFLGSALWLALPPGIAITGVVLSSNLLGEHLGGRELGPSPVRPFAGMRRRRAATAPTRRPARRDEQPLYTVRGLSVAFDGACGTQHRVLDDVSYSVVPGQTLALVGESASGKTVSVLGPLGLLGPAVHVTGSARLQGDELVGLDEKALQTVYGRRIGVVFQDALAALNPVRTIGAQLDDAVRNARVVPAGQERARSLELLELVGLPAPAAMADARAHELSGGMRQRALIAIALAGEPQLLVADEPTSALDVTTQAQILELLGRLRDERGMALIVISHDLAAVCELADTVAVIYAGRLVEHAPTAQLVARPDHPYTRGLLDAVPAPDAVPGTRFRMMPGTAGGGPDDHPGCSFAARCPLAQPRCHRARPPLEALRRPSTDEHRAACWVHSSVESTVSVLREG